MLRKARWRVYWWAVDPETSPRAHPPAGRARCPSGAIPFLAAGGAIVISRVGDLSHLLEQEQAALVVGHDPVEVATGCLRLFQDSSLRMQIEDSARRVSSQLLAWPIIVGDLESFYFQVAGGQPP